MEPYQHVLDTLRGIFDSSVDELVVDEAPWIFVVHDLNPRAMSTKVKGFVPPQSWFVDLTQVSVTK